MELSRAVIIKPANAQAAAIAGLNHVAPCTFSAIKSEFRASTVSNGLRDFRMIRRYL